MCKTQLIKHEMQKEKQDNNTSTITADTTSWKNI